jgi:hypothetical protein
MNCYSKLRGAVVLSALFICSLTAYGQVRWDGGGGDGQWTTATNWSGDILPAATDDVIIDNSLMPGNFTVSLPAGMVSITVKTVHIQPAAGNSIEVIIPASSTAAPALIATGPGYGLMVHAGGIFRNASGITSGQSLQVADSIRINNGGRYIHQTRGSHAASISQILSRDAGTETGVVEFDVPGTTGYVISASGRIYGTLVLSASAAGASRTYSSSGAGDLNIRGEFRLNAGVNYNVNLGGNVNVNENLFHNGTLFNISSGGDNSVLKLKKDLFQTGIITETSSGLPVIELCGTNLQQVQVAGSITNSITLRMNNAAGAVLQAPLSLPWKLELSKGRIKTSPTNLLTLLSGAFIQADSLSHDSFIDGPLRKDGLLATEHFLFPVGKDIYMRWVSLKNVTGNFTVEYFKSDPRQINTACGPGIDHISKLEYWTVESDNITPPNANVGLSFIDPNSGGVTDLSMLRVAQLVNNIWNDAGNTEVTGSAGANGSVTGNSLTDFSAAAKYFTLASSEASGNPLPVGITTMSAQVRHNINFIRWTYAGDDAVYFEIMHSTNKHDYKPVGKIYAMEGRRQYQFRHRSTGINYYKLYTMKRNGVFQAGRTMAVNNAGHSDWLLSVNGRDRITVTISSSRQRTEVCSIISASGSVSRQFTAWLSPGINNVLVDISGLPAGMYTIRSSTNSVLFAKL